MRRSTVLSLPLQLVFLGQIFHLSFLRFVLSVSVSLFYLHTSPSQARTLTLSSIVSLNEATTHTLTAIDKLWVILELSTIVVRAPLFKTPTLILLCPTGKLILMLVKKLACREQL